MVAVIFGSLIGMAIKGNREDAEERPGDYKYSKLVTEMEYTTKVRSLSDLAGKTNAEEAANEVQKDLKPKIAKDADAALLYVLAGKTLNQMVDPVALKTLQAGKRPVDKVATIAFTKPPKDKASVQKLQQRLGDLEDAEKLLVHRIYTDAGLPSEAGEIINGKYLPLAILLILGILGLAVVGLGLWIYEFTNWSNIRWMPPLLPASTQLRGATLGILMCGLAAMFQFFMILGAAAGSFKMDSPFMALSNFLFLGAIFAGLRWIQWEGKPMIRWFNQCPDSVSKQMLHGLRGYCMCLPVLAIILLVLSKTGAGEDAKHPISEYMKGGMTPATFWVLFSAAAITAPIWEEIGFRGLLNSGLTKLFTNPLIAALISSFVFAAIHPQGPAMWAGLGFIGFMSCLLVMRTRSIIPSITMHAIHNGMLLIIASFTM